MENAQGQAALRVCLSQQVYMCALRRQVQFYEAVLNLRPVAVKKAYSLGEVQGLKRAQLLTGKPGVVQPQVAYYFARLGRAVYHGEQDAVFGFGAEAVAPAGDAAQYGQHIRVRRENGHAAALESVVL